MPGPLRGTTFQRGTRLAGALLGLAACGGSAPPAAGPAPLCQAPLWWNDPAIVPESVSVNQTGGFTTSWDLDLELPSGTPVQLPHAAQLLAQAAYPWGWQPTFVDLESGHVFRFLHLRPQDAKATQVGALYAAGTVVGLSGGDTLDTGFGRDCEGHPCSTGAHLCVQSDVHVQTMFPPGGPACPAGSPGASPPGAAP